MMSGNSAGFTEIEHTADWALRVWAPDAGELFVQAARGMYWLMETTLQPRPRVERKLSLESGDLESLLVAFLSELLYLTESEGLGFDQFAVTVSESQQGASLAAALGGLPVAEQKKEIKAVTFHNLQILRTGSGVEATVVFDV